MASVTPSPAPGYFLNGQTVSFVFDASVVGVASSVNAAPPSISKYIAYDTLTPANPFIATTQDGKGNVVYDGGFPKFYNNAGPALGIPFSGLSATFKYLYNALHFVVNQDKLAAGNKKVLFLGDTTIASSYPLKATSAQSQTGFMTSMINLCSIAGFVPTFKDRSDFAGGSLDVRLAELEGYCALVVISSEYPSSVDYVTTQCVNDVVTFRENGNGIILITDHGPELNNIAEATANFTGFFSTANQFAVKFGAYFTGIFDRVPVNVGFLRTTYGDHPLYDNMTNDEYIQAGGSESKVVVTQNTISAKANFGTVPINTNGLNTLNLLVTKTDGSIETFRWVYSIQGAEFVFNKSVNPVSGVSELNGGKVYANLGGQFNMGVTLDGTTLGTIWGEILNGAGKRIGEVYYDSTVGNQVYWYAGAAGLTSVDSGEVITTQIRVPFDYGKSATVERKQPQIQSSLRLADMAKQLNTVLGLNATLSNVFKKTYEQIDTFLPIGQKGNKLNAAKNFKCVRDFFGNRIQNGTLTANIYANVTEVNNAITATGTVTPGKIFINAATGDVYAYKNGSYQVIVGLTAKDIFGAPRSVQNPTTLNVYQINTDSTIVLVS